MAKKLKAVVKIQIPAGEANPAPPVGPALGQYGVNIGEFCKSFNEKTKDKEGMVIPAVISIYEDRTFTYKLKSPPASLLLKKVIGLAKAASTPGKELVGEVSRKQLIEIAKKKMADLNTKDLEKAVKIVSGTALSMGIKVKDNGKEKD